jgi:hypothetical protein
MRQTTIGVPPNGQANFSLIVAKCLSDLETAYTMALACGEGMISSTLRDQVDNAYNKLRVYFPAAGSIDVTSTGKAIANAIATFYESILRTEDSEMREQLIALLDARLYSSRVDRRLQSLRNDSALTAISAADPLPLSLIMDDKVRAQVLPGGGLLVNYGISNQTPKSFLDAGRGNDGFATAVAARQAATDRISALIDRLGPLVFDVPWSRKIETAAFRTFFNPHVVANVELAVGSAGFQPEDVQLLPAGNGAHLSGDAADGVAGRVSAYDILRGDGVEAPGVGLIQQVEAGSVVAIDALVKEAAGSATISCNGVVLAVAPATVFPQTVVTPVGSLHLDRRYEADATFFHLIGSFSSVATGVLDIRVITPVPAAGIVSAVQLTSTSAAKFGDAVAMSAAEKVAAVRNPEFLNLALDYLHLREELSKDGVAAEMWLKTFAPYFIAPGTNATYLTQAPLTSAQQGVIRGWLLNPASWNKSYNFEGLLRKLYEDCYSLMGKAQVTDFA